MVVVGLDSGMGNQMFQYAMGYSLAKERKEDFFIDISQFKYNARPYALDAFQISAPYFEVKAAKKNNKFHRALARLSRLKKMGILNSVFVRESRDRRNMYCPEQIPYGKSVYLSGFWQNYRYFDKYCDDIINEFQIKNTIISSYANDILNDIQKSKREIVAIHLRRGDYAKCDHWLLPSHYYAQAVQKFIEMKGNDLEFYLFTEESNYAAEVMGDINYRIVTNKELLSDIEEFWIMKNCTHHIISNSTYSWWAAYLNDSNNHIVIAPVYSQWTREFYPEGWQVIRCLEKME